MNVLIALIIITTIVQLVVCHISLWWFIAVIARVLFCLRVIGATFKVRTLAIIEAVAAGSMLVYNMLVHKDNVPWLRMFEFIIFSGLCVLFMYLDDILYVYVIEDDDDD